MSGAVESIAEPLVPTNTTPKKHSFRRPEKLASTRPHEEIMAEAREAKRSKHVVGGDVQVAGAEKADFIEDTASDENDENDAPVEGCGKHKREDAREDDVSLDGDTSVQHFT